MVPPSTDSAEIEQTSSSTERPANAIIVASGDHITVFPCGKTTPPSFVDADSNSRRPVPSTHTVATWLSPDAPRENAISEPSGDHAGYRETPSSVSRNS